MSDIAQCICRRKPTRVDNGDSDEEDFSFKCSRCGEFSATADFVDDVLPRLPVEMRPSLSAATRQPFTASRPRVRLTKENWRELAEEHHGSTVSQKIDKLLSWIGDECRRPGRRVLIGNDDYPMVDCSDEAELWAYIRYLLGEKLIDERSEPDKGLSFAPTIVGWRALEPMGRPGGEPGRCFVAMSFADETECFYKNGIELAIRDAGFVPDRVKEDPTNKAVIDRILSGIRRAQFVVADFTGQRPSVYYEAGFARGIGREVIGTCRNTDTKGLAFDTRHLGHVVWKDADDLRAQLANSIRANIIPVK